MSGLKMIFTGVIAAAILFLCGCDYVDEPITLEQVPMKNVLLDEPPAEQTVDPTDSSLAARYSDAPQELTGTAEEAILWSDKYEQLSEKYKALTEENMSLVKENSDLQKRIMTLEDELNKTRQELAEANSFLQEMHAELTRWKGDVLGFRDEMRQAQAAQIQALTRVLRLLGAETSEPLAMNNEPSEQ